MRAVLLCIAALSFVVSTAEENNNSEIMLIGVFHFANPGLDMVKSEDFDVLSDESQRYIREITRRIASYKPTHVLLECLPEVASEYNAKYDLYLKDEFTLTSSESYQLGFRIARNSGLSELHCYDDKSVGWKAEEMMGYMSENDSKLQQAFNEKISEVTAEMEVMNRTLSLQELLLKYNSEEYDNENKGLYLLTNSAGAGDGFSGADASASWWHRNFKMYANIQRIAVPETRLVVIAGQGHTAILRDFVEYDESRVEIDVVPYLKSGN